MSHRKADLDSTHYSAWEDECCDTGISRRSVMLMEVSGGLATYSANTPLIVISVAFSSDGRLRLNACGGGKFRPAVLST